MNQWKSALVAPLFANLFLLTACSNNTQFLKGMNLSVNQQNSESFVNLSAEIDLGNLALDSLSFPVLDPHSGKELGQITLGAGPNGKEQVTLSLSANALLKGDASLGATLPNGLPLPSALGLTSGQMLAIPALNYSRVYIGGDLKSSIVVGVALAVQALDRVTGSIGLSSNIFFSQVFNPNLSGVAGIYASGTAHQNGIAVFGKYTATAVKPTPVTASLRSLAQLRTRDANTEETEVSSFSFSGVTGPESANVTANDGMSERSQEKLYRYFYGKKRTLRPH